MKTIISTNNAPKAIGPYSQAIDTGNTIYMSGQLPVDPKTNELVENDIVVQTTQSLENIKAILAEVGLTTDNIVKTTVFLADINEFGKMNEVYAKYFSEGNYPARSAIQVANLPKGARVEIECIVVR